MGNKYTEYLKAELLKKGANKKEVEKIAYSFNKYLETPENPVFKMTAQTDYSCGPAACRIALKKLGIDRPESELRKELQAEPKKGTEIDNIKTVFENMGLDTIEKTGAWVKDLKSALEKGYSVIIRYYMPEYNADHYSVLNAIDKEMHFLDPFYGVQKMDAFDFVKLWHTDAGLGNKPGWFIGIKQKDNTAKTDEGLQESIQAVLKKFTINRKFDIPFIAGYSNNGKTIYIDKSIPDTIEADGKKIDTIPFLAIHEIIEKQLIDALNLDYIQAHQLALRVESAYINSYGIAWDAYDKIMNELKKQIDAKPIEYCPSDLDLTPYNHEAIIYPGDKKILEAVKSAMKRTMEANHADPKKK